MLFKVTSYLNFLLKSTGYRNIQTPEIYKIIKEGLLKKTPISLKNNYLEYRNKLLSNHNNILVQDFGAGSKVFKGNERVIAKIAKYAGLSKKRALLLLNLTNYLAPNHILEIGTSVGLGTAALHLGAPSAKLTTIEGCPNTLAVATDQFNSLGYKNITPIEGEFNKVLQELQLESKQDLIYFDGNHQKEATLTYFNFFLQHIHNDTVFLFDDIHWSKEMEEAWQEIQQHSKVALTIDTYQWGLVFFNKELAKKHLTIRL